MRGAPLVLLGLATLLVLPGACSSATPGGGAAGTGGSSGGAGDAAGGAAGAGAGSGDAAGGAAGAGAGSGGAAGSGAGAGSGGAAGSGAGAGSGGAGASDASAGDGASDASAEASSDGASDAVAGSDGGTDAADADAGDASTASLDVGPAGGTLAIAGATISIPAGALAQSVTIGVTRTADAAPAGYTALSPVFAFTPDNLSFATPVVVTIAYAAGTATSIEWSQPDGTYFPATGTVSAGTVTGSVTHFSRGFVQQAGGSCSAAFCPNPGTGTPCCKTPEGACGSATSTSTTDLYGHSYSYKTCN